jgi:hypothetical protein
MGYDQYLRITVKGKKEPIELLAEVMKDWIEVTKEDTQYKMTLDGWGRYTYAYQGILLIPASSVKGTLPHSKPTEYNPDYLYFDIVEFAKENKLDLELYYEGEKNGDAERITVLPVEDGQVKVHFEIMEWVEARFTDDRKKL